MADNATQTPTDNNNGQPQLAMGIQYVKDLSFENPQAPQSLLPGEPPQIQVGVEVGARTLGNDHYEVALHLRAEAKRGNDTVFVAELLYGGVFQAANIAQDQLEPILLIECPRLLFPFARRILADATRDGGFPPLMLDPIDFVSLYQRGKEQRAQQAAQTTVQ